jgi:methanogenic corrinoid protein MtbC1
MTDYALMNQLLYEGKHKEVKAMTEEGLAAGLNVDEVLEDGLIAGMRVVGEDFKHNRIFVPSAPRRGR